MGAILSLEDWHSKYIEAIEKSINSEYILGESDCTTFVSDIVQAISGIDIAYRSRGSYDSEKTMLKFLDDNGGIRELVSETLGAPIENVLNSRKGYVLEIKSKNRTTLAICDGSTALHKNTKGVIERVDMSEWIRGWKTWKQ